MNHVQLHTFDGVGGPLEEVCRHVLAATTHLLGTTITLSESDWSAPSALPGWTRSHVAAHLANDGLALRAALDALALGIVPDQVFPAHDERNAAISLGASRSPLEVQIALDTSAGQLASCMHHLPQETLDIAVRLNERVSVPARMLPLLRLSEVVLHHCDLADGYTLDSLADEAVLWCLQLRAHLLIGRSDYPSLRIITTDGDELFIGAGEPTEVIRGDARTLLSWITGRTSLPGAPHLPLI